MREERMWLPLTAPQFTLPASPSHVAAITVNLPELWDSSAVRWVEWYSVPRGVAYIKEKEYINGLGPLRKLSFLPFFLTLLPTLTGNSAVGRAEAGEGWVCGQRRRPKLSFAFVVARATSFSIYFHINWHSELKSKVTVSTRGWSLDDPGISTGILRSFWASWAWAYQAARRKSHFSWIVEGPPVA